MVPAPPKIQDQRHLAAAEQFLSEAPHADGRDDAVRLVLKLPSGERVERTFNAQDGATDGIGWPRPWDGGFLSHGAYP